MLLSSVCLLNLGDAIFSTPDVMVKPSWYIFFFNFSRLQEKCEAVRTEGRQDIWILPSLFRLNIRKKKLNIITARNNFLSWLGLKNRSKSETYCIPNWIIVQQDETVFSLLHICRQLYIFRVLTPNIKSPWNGSRPGWPVPEAVIIAVPALDDGWQHQKYLELLTEM